LKFKQKLNYRYVICAEIPSRKGFAPRRPGPVELQEKMKKMKAAAE
jgi:hypothetical protein